MDTSSAPQTLPLTVEAASDVVRLEVALRIVRQEVGHLLQQLDGALDRLTHARRQGTPYRYRGGSLVRPVDRSLPLPPPGTGRDIAARRRALGISQRRLAAHAGYVRQTLAEVERGKRHSPHSIREFLRALDDLEAHARSTPGVEDQA